MAKAKKPAKPKQAITKTEQKKRQLTSNAANKTLAQQEREKAQLKQAKVEAAAQKAYDRAYKLIAVQAAKQAGRDAALKDFKKGKRK